MVQDWWADYGSREPTPAEAAAFSLRVEAAEAEKAWRRAQAASAASPDGAVDVGLSGGGAMIVLVAAALLLFMAMPSDDAVDSNHGQRRGAAAMGDCAARGGGLCRFM